MASFRILPPRQLTNPFLDQMFRELIIDHARSRDALVDTRTRSVADALNDRMASQRCRDLARLLDETLEMRAAQPWERAVEYGGQVHRFPIESI